MKNPECAPRTHKYTFLGNKTFTTMSSTSRGTTVRMSKNAVYKCEVCAKVVKRPYRHD